MEVGGREGGVREDRRRVYTRSKLPLKRIFPQKTYKFVVTQCTTPTSTVSNGNPVHHTH